MKKVFLIGAGILVLLVVVLVATGSFKFSARIGGENNVPPKGGIAQETVVPEGWTKYVSGEFGYTILYPDGW
ncbi:MAG: hypothetical protein U1A23_04925, partial [Candidatus Sungbacteria bacterium]|nr:hypothetical protein [Candidatus Sungbacteria bacterium]